ncbi:hypothetical protein DFJ74DRAFT_665568 [Hyaloraphidium curvatum]|nr:hypothetical protein DFJ74DRAFT_665568 [Hyaloraphidium curvatum]
MCPTGEAPTRFSATTLGAIGPRVHALPRRHHRARRVAVAVLVSVVPNQARHSLSPHAVRVAGGGGADAVDRVNEDAVSAAARGARVVRAGVHVAAEEARGTAVLHAGDVVFGGAGIGKLAMWGQRRALAGVGERTRTGRRRSRRTSGGKRRGRGARRVQEGRKGRTGQ